MINGKTKVLGLIGDPVEHTLSPVIHNTLSDIYEGGESAVYVPFPVKRGDVETALKGAFSLGIQGLNVTVPHKSAVIPFLEDIDPMAKAIGAVNTLVRGDKGYVGYNTDATGFIRALKAFGKPVEGKTAAVLGAGGASRAVVFALSSVGVSEIYIFNRTPERAAELAASLSEYAKDCRVYSGTYDEISTLYDREFFVVQCTSVGLAPDIEGCVIDDGEFFANALWGMDIVYKPAKTQFMKRMEAAGKPACNGLSMLLYQAVDAYEKFMGTTVSELLALKAGARLQLCAGVADPIVLIGCMGSGKTSVSNCLKKLGFEVLDADAEIERRSGMTINRIFEEQGEKAFRDMETELLKELSGKAENGFVLSAGGGMPVREENRELLKKIGKTVYLRAGVSTLCRRLEGDTTRPLLVGGGLKAKIEGILSDREAVYMQTAHEVIDTDDMTAEEIAVRILSF